MRTPLDDAKTWFLDEINYQGELQVIVAEGFVGDGPEDLRIGDHVIRDTYPIETRSDGRYFTIRFPHSVAWQVVDESFTSFDEYEQRDDTGTVQILTRSKYVDYDNASHGWYADVRGLALHYRVWTENEVIDVVACEPPVIEPWIGE